MTTAEIIEASGARSLDEKAKRDEIENVLREAARLLAEEDELTGQMVRQELTSVLNKTSLKAAARVVDAALRVARKPEGAPTSGQGRPMTFEDVAPWPEPVDGSGLLAEVARMLARYVVLPPGAATAVALWIFATWVYDAAFLLPILVIRSATMRCGKSTLLDVLRELVRRALSTTNITPAALFRVIEAHHPTLLIDEADTFADREVLRGILNSGYRRDGVVTRTVGDDHESRNFSTWGPKAVAGIGHRAGTVEDRSIAIVLKRKKHGEHVAKVRLRYLIAEGRLMRRKLARWANDNLEALREAEPDRPDLGNDRAEDNWEFLIAIADHLGGVWPERARRAATVLSGKTDPANDEMAVQLLRDIRWVFIEWDTSGITTANLLSELTGMVGRPWADWDEGEPLTASQLAGLLRPFGVKSVRARYGPDNAHGYKRKDFVDAWERYLDPDDVPGGTEQPEQASNDAPEGPPGARNNASDVPEGRAGESGSGTSTVPGVPASSQTGGEALDDCSAVGDLFGDVHVA